MVMKLKSVFILGSCLLLFALPLVSAYWGGYSSWGYGWFRTADLLENEWVIFSMLFAIFYATIFASLGKVFKENKAVPAVISLALAFLVTAGIQRQWMFLERPIMFWALILTIALVLLTFFRAMKIGPAMFFGVLFILVALWGTVKSSISTMLPYGIVSFIDSIGPFRWIFGLIGIGLIGYSWSKSASRAEGG